MNFVLVYKTKTSFGYLVKLSFNFISLVKPHVWGKKPEKNWQKTVSDDKNYFLDYSGNVCKNLAHMKYLIYIMTLLAFAAKRRDLSPQQ